MGFGGWVKKTAEKAKKKVEGTVKKGLSETEKLARKAKEEAERALRDAERELEEGLRKARGPADELAARLKHAAETGMSVVDIEKLLKKGLEDVRKDVLDRVLRELDGKIKDPVERIVTREIPKLATERLPDLIESALEEAGKELEEAITGEGLKVARAALREAYEAMKSDREENPDLSGELDQVGVEVGIGPLTLTYDGFYERAEKILGVFDHYANHPPAFRRKDVVDFVEAVGPTSVDAGLAFRAAFFVASTNALEVSFRMTSFRLKLFTRIADRILDKMGVPE